MWRADETLSLSKHPRGATNRRSSDWKVVVKYQQCKIQKIRYKVKCQNTNQKMRGFLVRWSSKKKKSDEVAALQSLLGVWSDAYYNSGSPLVSDEEFDAVRARLVALDAEAADASVGAPVSFGAVRVRHKTPLLSLLSVRSSVSQVSSFVSSVAAQLECKSDSLAWSSEFKYDGVALALRFAADGTLLGAATRGDGREGEAVDVARLGQAVPRLVNSGVLNQECEVRGELLLPRREFEETKRELGYRSARNAVAGLLRNERAPDPRLPLRFVAYAIESSKINAADYHLRVALLKELGFQPCPHWRLHENWEADGEQRLAELAAMRDTLEFDTDGVVIKLNSRRLSDALGCTRHHPKHSIAFKWSSSRLPVTILQRIDWQVDQSGALRPVAIVDPPVVCDDGAVLSRASLHNWAFVDRHGLAPGVSVQMERAGGTVPHLVPFENLGRAAAPALRPSHCPCIEQAPVEPDPPLNLRCSRGMSCPERIAYRAYAVGCVLQIRGLGLSSTRQMAHACLLSQDNAWAVLSITAAQLEALSSGWGPVRSEKLVKEMALRVNAATFEQTLGTILTGTGVGPAVWKGLAEEYPSLTALAQASEEELATLPDVGVLSASSIRQRVNLETLNKLERQIKAVKLPVAAAQTSESLTRLSSASLPLRGLQVSVTGTLSLPRSQFASIVRARGGSLVASLSGKTSVLIVGKEPTKDKIDKAERLSIPIETEEEFRKKRLD